MRVLHVVASPRARSRSDQLAATFLDALGAAEVTRLDLWHVPMPALDEDTIEGRYRLIQGQPVEREVDQRWAELRAVADQALAHDLWLIATPMWNFGIPYVLKHWIDAITHPGMTFANDALGNVTGLAAGRRLVIIGAGALTIAEPEAEQEMDFQMRYLDHWARFIGITDVHAVRAAPTFGPDDLVATAMAAAAADLTALAVAIRSGDAPG